MKKLVFLLSLGIVVACNPDNRNDAVDDDDDMEHQEVMVQDNKLDEDVQEFIMAAASGGLMEVELGKLASEKAQNQQVKDFGQRMVTDHGKANNQLKTIAAAMSLTLPQEMKEDHRKKIEKLRALNGTEFDKEYISMMVKDHKEDVKKFEDVQDEIEGQPQLSGWVAQTLPVLRQHLEQVKQIDDSLDD